ncbi:hypothetical protein H109_03827 [Trichophyton interdigitale MR816]|uniref:Uncharacterized protein n=1 Tax=Trichophyton interdigitale (strain MR816) TaxID=1215338 RepID=A0A059J920_TRIIM|nr:hypothetical protein H109_03827 [Trichophyton interdigitale MR816]
MGNMGVDGKVEVIRAERGTERPPPQELCTLKQLHDDSSLRSLALPGRAERNSYGTGSTAIVSPCQMTKIYNLTAQISRLWIDVSATSAPPPRIQVSWTKEKFKTGISDT